MSTDLTRFFAPRSIAVIGVSRHAAKVGARIFRNLQTAGFPGRLVPIHPTASSLFGVRASPSVAALGKPVDLAVIATPATTVPALLMECGKAGIRNVIIISAGFGEVGGVGQEREAAVHAISKRYRMKLLGPNCLGVLVPAHRLNATFADMPKHGGAMTILSQSGAMAVALMDWARERDMGIRAMVSMGNKAGLTETELVEHFGRDPKTAVLVLYLESVERGGAFWAACRRVVRRKPIVLLHAGTTAVGQKAAKLHTGKLVGDRAVFREAMESAGVIVVEQIEDLYDASVAGALGSAPAGNRVAIVTNAGGPGIMAADALAASPLSFARFSERTSAALRRHLPAAASIANPVDMVGDATPDRYRTVIRVLLTDPGVDAVLAVLTPQVVTQPSVVAQTLLALQRTCKHKRIVASFLGGSAVRRSRQVLLSGGIAHYEYPEDAVRVLAALWRAAQAQRPAQRPAPAQRHPHRGRLRTPGLVQPPEAHRILRRWGFSIVRESLGQTEHAVLAAARRIGYPVTLKFIHPRLVHKTEERAVWTHIGNRHDLRATFRRGLRSFRNWPAAQHAGWLVQRHASGTRELFLGAKRDPAFGPVVLLGLGGVDVELLHTTVLLLPPYSASVIAERIRTSSLWPWFAASRGRSALPLQRIAADAVRLGRFMLEQPAVREVDINPLLVDAERGMTLVLDGRIMVEEV